MNKLIEASFYKKEGIMIWIMYYIFFILGYGYGIYNEGIKWINLFFLIMLIIIAITGKKDKEK